MCECRNNDRAACISEPRRLYEHLAHNFPVPRVTASEPLIPRLTGHVCQVGMAGEHCRTINHHCVHNIYSAKYHVAALGK